MNNPKVSVVIPIYNVEQYLDRCILSVVNQSLKDIEIILVDDESPDNSSLMCDEWAKKDKRIKVVHKKNGGLGFARNSGLDVATGEYVTFLDSDDVVNLSTYHKCYNHALEDYLDICYFDNRRFEFDKEIDINSDEPGEYELIVGKQACEEYMLNMVGKIPGDNSKKNYSMSSCMAIYKRTIFEDNHIRFVSEKNVASEDLLFHLDYLPYVNRIGKMTNTFYYYYINPGSITNSYNDGKRDRMLYLLEVVREKLSKRFAKEVYLPHFFTQVLRIYKVALRFESKQECSYHDKSSRIIQLCNNDILNDLFMSRDISKYSLKDKSIIYFMKHKIVFPIVLMYKIFK